MNSKTCSGMSFSECELAILRSAVDTAEIQHGEEMVNTPRIKKILEIVEKFIKDKKLLVYGGTAINNILPQASQFYDTKTEIPDYDFYSPNALEDAKELSDIYAKKGFNEVEAKGGVHHGTYKVFVDFIPVADITQMQPELFKSLNKHSVVKNNIRYSPPNFLRMSMYLELSRPKGDVGRWEKILKRLTLLNKHYPLSAKYCFNDNYQRKMDYSHSTPHMTPKDGNNKSREIYDIVLTELVRNNVVFFGGYAMMLYSKYMPTDARGKVNKIPDFDVIAEDSKKVAENVKINLVSNGIKNVTIDKHTGVNELISDNYEIKVGENTVAFIYSPVACHSYNVVDSAFGAIRVATIDTMLSFYLAFLYIDRPYYDTHRILCMSKYLFKLEEKNRLSQKGLLKRFSLSCLGHQPTLNEMRSIKAKKFSALKKSDPEYESWFLRYRPLSESDKKPIKKKPIKDNKTSKVRKNKTNKTNKNDKNDKNDKTNKKDKKKKNSDKLKTRKR